MLQLRLRCNIEESTTATSKLSFIENKGVKEKKNIVVAGSMTADPAVVCERGRSLAGPFKG